ncbi:MAG: hypothetical protein ACJAT7_002117 [Psychromonas sp.]|jgi:hypothetical protein|uniref:ice-binding family protein n=1 Tax=Psychromonas sp. TaxID=1884585 RepID=UPI0039E717DD
MKVNHNIDSRILWVMTMLLTTLMAGCNNDKNNEPVASTPAIISSNVADMPVDVAINSKISATFSETMDPATFNELSFSIAAGNEMPIIATVSLDNASNTAIFTPKSNFDASTLYTATISRAVTSARGTPLANDHQWSFTTAATPDTSRPTVTAIYPLDGATNFALNRNITVEMSESLDPSTLRITSFILTDGTKPVLGSVSYTGKTISFNPAGDLASNTVYTVTLTTSLTDLAFPANPLAVNYVSSFTTGTDVAEGPALVNLRSAGNMVILAKAGISNVPISNISGNIGSSPITAAAMDNLICDEISGTIYGADATYTGSGDVSCFAGSAPDSTLVANAVLDMGTAYADAAGRISPDFTELYTGDLSGQTLSAGLYKWGTDVLILSDMTLEGGANDAWIFQISGDLLLADASRIVLAGGAQAKNIFWQVGGGTGAVIGTTAHFEGIILAEKAITVNTGASVNGRLFAHSAVTLDHNAVTQPAQ